MKIEIENQLLLSSEVKRKSILLSNDIEKCINLITDAIKRGNKILVAGNGGSAADAQHMAAEFVGRFRLERKAIPCISLTTDTSIITAWSNDYNFESIYERQIEALGQEGDIFIGISTSGNSANIIRGIKKAKDLQIKCICLLGKHGGVLKEAGDVNLIVPSDDTPRIQEVHETIIHIICDLVEKQLFKY